jgi:hypothetical protein
MSLRLSVASDLVICVVQQFFVLQPPVVVSQQSFCCKTPVVILKFCVPQLPFFLFSKFSILRGKINPVQLIQKKRKFKKMGQICQI